jgi:hypothetical protein
MKPYLERMGALLRSGRPAAAIMQDLQVTA